jgi:hypothetical protein
MQKGRLFASFGNFGSLPYPVFWRNVPDFECERIPTCGRTTDRLIPSCPPTRPRRTPTNACCHGCYDYLTDPDRNRRTRTSAAELLKVVPQSYQPRQIVLLADGGENQEFLAQHVPKIADMAPINGKATAYVCRNFACDVPVTDPDALRAKL